MSTTTSVSYEIVIEGMSDQFASTFPSVGVSNGCNGATVVGPVRDNAELMVVLEYLINRNIAVLSVRRRHSSNSPGVGAGRPTQSTPTVTS